MKKQADFAREVQPILQARCNLCHGSEVQMGGLRLDQRQSVFKGGKSGIPAIVAGKSAQGLLVRYISGLDPKLVMPPTGERLSAGEISLISQWIAQGAAWPDETQSSKPAHPAPTDHWAFKRVRALAVPAVKNSGWVRNSIDNFVLSKLETKNWTPSPSAEPRTLLRRTYLDIIGMRPSIAEQEAFLQSPTPAALDRVVTDLLARPAYGERWGGTGWTWRGTPKRTATSATPPNLMVGDIETTSFAP